MKLPMLRLFAEVTQGVRTSQGQSLRLPDGLLVPKRALHQKAVELDASHSNAHNNLAVSLRRDEVLSLQQGPATQRSLFQQAVELDPGNAVAHCNLGVVLGDHEVVRLQNGSLWDKRSLFVKSIELDPGWALAYNNLANLLAPQEWVRLADGCWDRRGLYLAALQLDESYGVAYNNLALTLGFREKVRCLDRVWDRRSLHRRALELCPRHICAYRDLALALQPGERMSLDGQDFGQRELLLEAIRLDSSFASAYKLLARTLSPEEHVQEQNKTQLLVKALELDPHDAPGCAELGLHLGSGHCQLQGTLWCRETGAAAAPGGSGNWSGAQLMQRALQLAPSCPEVLLAASAGGGPLDPCLLRAAALGNAVACRRLALALAPGGRVRVPFEEQVRLCSRRQLLLRACEEMGAECLVELALELEPNERICIQGSLWDARALLRQALQLQPNSTAAAELQRRALAPFAEACPLLMRHAADELFDSTDWQDPGFAPADAPGELDCLSLTVAALEMGESQAHAWDELGELLGPKDRVRLRGRTWSRLELHLRALELDCASSRTWTNLGVTVDKLDFQGCHYSSEEIFQRALELDPENTAAQANLTIHRGQRPRLPVGRARSSEAQRLIEASLTMQEKACKLDPRSGTRRLRLANALIDTDLLETQQRHGLRLSHLLEAFRLDPNNPELCQQLGDMLCQTGTTLQHPEGSWGAEALLSRAALLQPQAGQGKQRCEGGCPGQMRRQPSA
ncbi:unnamed protein product [Effrenium voratum]|uniref:Uncharacterized protein n=1 Tax=Effrenium voratum TaxID=2562239 RepID=A0AA36NFH7_9DINO|nr:unnamed protein product [Effrenium voratum]